MNLNNFGKNWLHHAHCGHMKIHLQAFSPCDAMRKHGFHCCPVSFCPSITLVDCIQTAEDIVKLFFPAR